MILPTYRPIYRDELTYGWICDLAEMNFSGDIYRIQRTAKMLFPYGYAPERRYAVRKGEKVRLDYMLGLDESLRRLRDDGYHVPETDDLITYNTVLGTMSICRKPSTQARYMYTALTTVYGDLLDMPAPATTVKAVRICPACMRDNEYIRTWHQLPGVTACAVHGIRLVQDSEGCEDHAEQADEPEVIYARYVKDIYDDPAPADLDDIRSALIGTASVKEINRLGQNSTSFEYVVRLLIGYGLWYRDVKKVMLPHRDSISDGVRLYYVISTYENGIAVLKCPSCGRIFATVPRAVETGFGCPDCIHKEHPKAVIDRALKQTGDGWYHIVGPFRGMGAVHEVKHMTCGRSTKMRITARIWDRQECSCEKPHSVDDVQTAIDAVSSGFQVIGYRPNTESTTIRHDACGKTRTYNLQQFIRSPVCPHCRDAEYNSHAVTRIMAVIGDSYDYVSTASSGRERIYTVRHKICGTEISGSMRQFTGNRYIRPKRCPLCYRYEKGTRILKQSDAGAALKEMTSWFKDHKIWVLKQHKKIGHNTVQKLVKNGLIFHVGFGMYSPTSDVSVYDLITERYLKDASGKNIGQYIGETADYISGKRREEPDVITLESSLIKRTKKRTHRKYIICGRTVIVNGINY